MLRKKACTTWHHTLEEWTKLQFGRWERNTNPRPVPFAPYEAHRPEAFHAIPVVLFVLTERTRTFHSEFVQAVDLIRTSTSGFRPVLFTDSIGSPAINACDWPVEQCLPENVGSFDTNWLDGAARHLMWTHYYFGATYVFAPESTEKAALLLRELSTAYNAVPAVCSEAVATLYRAPQACAGIGNTARGGWDELPPGELRQSFISTNGGIVNARLRIHARGRGVLLAESGVERSKLHSIADAAGMNSLTIIAVVPESQSLAEAVMRAGAQALSSGGAIVLYGRPITEIADDARLVPSEVEGGYNLFVKDEAVLRFPIGATSRVLTCVNKWTKR